MYSGTVHVSGRHSKRQEELKTGNGISSSGRAGKSKEQLDAMRAENRERGVSTTYTRGNEPTTGWQKKREREQHHLGEMSQGQLQDIRAEQRAHPMSEMDVLLVADGYARQVSVMVGEVV